MNLKVVPKQKNVMKYFWVTFRKPISPIVQCMETFCVILRIVKLLWVRHNASSFCIYATLFKCGINAERLPEKEKVGYPKASFCSSIYTLARPEIVLPISLFI